MYVRAVKVAVVLASLAVAAVAAQACKAAGDTDGSSSSSSTSSNGGGSGGSGGGGGNTSTSAWDTNYIAANAYAHSPGSVPPSLNIVAREDNTTVTMVPVAAVAGGGGIPAGPANQPLNFVLNAGEHAQLSQNDELSGSVIDADKPIGLMAGHVCHYVPVNNTACDHGEQMVPAVNQLGHEYVAVGVGLGDACHHHQDLLGVLRLPGGHERAANQPGLRAAHPQVIGSADGAQ